MLMEVRIPTVDDSLLLLWVTLDQYLATVRLLWSLGCRMVLHVNVKL